MKKKSNNIIGIEVSNMELSMYQGDDHMHMSVRRLPDGIIEDGRIADIEKLAQFINNTKKAGEFEGRDVAVVLPEYSTFFRSLQMPPMSEAELKLNLPYEFRDFVGDNEKDYFYDYAMDEILYDREDNPVSMKLFAGAALKETIAEMEKLMKMAGLKLKVAIPRDMSLINLFRNAIDEGAYPDRQYCLIDIGKSNVCVDIIQDAQLKGSKVIDFGSHEIDKAIAEKYEISLEDAAEYRKKNQDGVLDGPECRAVYERLAIEIMKGINFYQYENPDSQISELYFCGTDSSIEQLKGTILDYLGVEEKSIREVLPSSCKNVSGAYRGIAAIGATL